MKSPMWNQLLVDVPRCYPSESNPRARLTPDQVEELQAVENAAENFAITIGHGLAAVGELLAHAASHNELTDELVLSTGWLVSSLALLTMTMSETGAAATYKLGHIPHQGDAK
ncbi:hypothetical protein EC919_104349 [Pseudomonas graminis]|uniref:hypothetical protein n=1 Tax=Pseudomonas graminis TaxID=158627 RepID=UPI001061E45C|nr:hypothetical protein [Pseudomonas graminis]TDV54610.1 hypothetical protein EC919_104349 [Pseudomonas graminis]